MLNLPKFNVSPEQHKLRQNNHAKSGENLAKSIASTSLMDMCNINVHLPLPDAICMASNPKWANRIFGAVNTVEKSACVCFVAKLILEHPEFKNYFGDVTMEEVLYEAESKGYRMWKLANRKTTLNSPSASLEYFKEVFSQDKEIQSCKTLEEVYSIAGVALGIGGSMFFIDNLIAQASRMEVASQTRVQSVEQMIANLQSGYPVPIRVNNSVYLNNPCKKEGHYVTIFGFEHGYAIIVDSSHNENGGILKLPVWRLFKAMTEDANLISAWNTCIR